MQHNLFQLQAPFAPSGDQPRAIEQLVAGLHDGLMYQTLLGVTGSGKTFTVANMIAQIQRPALILTPNKTLAAQTYAEIKGFFPNNAVEYFVSYYDYYQPEAYVPASGVYIEKDASINEQIEQLRLSATKSLLERSDTIIVATVSAIYGLGDPQAYLKMVLTLRPGDVFQPREAISRLIAMQYERNDLSLTRGTFRVRGEVIDVFPADAEDEVVRFEWFDDVVEKISVIDPLTAQRRHSLPRVTVFPKSHYVTPRENILTTIEQMKIDLTAQLAHFRANNQLVEAQRLEERTRFDMEMMLELGYCSGIENYSRYLSGRAAGEPPPSLIEYLPANAVMVIDESHVTIPQLGAMYRGDRARKENLVNYGFRLPVALDNRPLRFEEFEQLSPQTIFVSATPGPYESEHQSQVVELLLRPTGIVDPQVTVRPVTDQVNDLLSEVQQRVDQQERVLVTTLTKRLAEDLTEYLSEQGVRIRYLHSDVDTVERVQILQDLRAGVFDVLVGINLLREGLDLPEVSLVAILDADKEGFLRSERSLIQTMGRAARHIRGAVILYADKITQSMERAMTETSRRRDYQEAYNQQHGITPRAIVKAQGEILDGVRVAHPRQGPAKRQRSEPTDMHSWDAKRCAQEIERLQKQMSTHVQALEFEEAAACRDTIQAIRNVLLMQQD